MDYPSSWLQGDSLGEKISCELRLKIIKGNIIPGTILSENHLAAEFGTSRSPIRDALKVLSNEGLIRLERMGASVLGLNPKDMEELYDVRFLLEGFALQRLSKGLNENKVKELHQIIDKLELAANHDDCIQFAYHDLQFHETIILGANHTRILYIWNHIRNIVLTALLVATERRFAKEKIEIQPLIERHKLVVSALVSRDESYIKKVIQEHFNDTQRTVEGSLFVSQQDKT